MWVISAILAAASLLSSLAQEPIKVRVNLVNVAFTARDARGALVENLTKDDLELFEDTVPQKIEFFSRSTDLPLTLALVMDVSGSQEHFEKKHEKDLEVFLKDVLGPRDRAFMVCFGNHLRLVSDYTNSAEQILSNFHEFDKGKRHFPEIGPEEERDLGTAFYDSIYYSVREKLALEGGRQAILMFSDGEDNSSSHNMMTAIEAAQSANVVIYTIRYTEPNRHGELNARNKYGISVMERIAKETGGAHIDAQHTDPHTYFLEIAAKDDTFRKIRVKVKDDSIKVRAKTGYFSQ